MAEPLRVVVAGLGNMGRSHGLAYHTNPGFEIAALINRSDVPLPDGLSGYGIRRSFDDALGDEKPDVACIATYSDSHADYAVKAFEANAVDYLLKPVNVQRLTDAVHRARTHLSARSGQTESLEVGPLGPSDPRKTIVVKDRDRFLVVKTSDIDWFESAANYVELHVNRRSFLVRMTMNELQAKLKGTSFVRIHRSAIVNLDRVTEIRPSPHGDFQVHLSDGHVLRLSRAYRDQLLP